MDLTRLTVADAPLLTRPGKTSAQIVSRRNAPGAQITVTRVVMQPRAVSPVHRHDGAEQTWIVERGSARLLTDDGPAGPLVAGDVVITPPGRSHGIENTGEEAFVYLTVPIPVRRRESRTARLRDFYCEQAPSAFAPARGGWGRNGATRSSGAILRRRSAGRRSTVRPSSSHHPQTSETGEDLAGRSRQAAAAAGLHRHRAGR